MSANSQNKRRRASKLKTPPRTRVFIGLFVLIFGSCVLLLLTVDRDVRKELLNEWNARQEILGHEAYIGLNNQFQHWENVLETLATNPNVIADNAFGRMHMQLAYGLHTHAIEAITRVRYDGEITASYPSTEVVGKNISHQTHFQELRQSHRRTVSGIFRSVQGYRTLAIHEPIIDGDTCVGSLGILVPIDELAREYLEGIPKHYGTYVWLVSKSGEIIYSRNQTEIGQLFDEVLPDLMHKSADGETQDTERIHFDNFMNPYADEHEGEQLHCMCMPIQIAEQDWLLRIASPQSSILASLDEYRNQWLLIMSAMCAGLIAVAWYLTRSWSLFREYSTRIRADESIRRSEARFRRVAENAGEWIFCYDIINHRYTYCSKAIKEISGYKPAYVYDHPDFLTEICHDEDRKHFLDLIERTRSKDVSDKLEMRIRDKQGQDRWLSIRLVSVFDASGQVDAIEGIANDITARKKSEQSLRDERDQATAASDAKTEFLAMMSHELRTPLNPIIGFSDLMLMDSRTEDERQSLKIIKQSGEHLLAIINDILDISRIESGKLELEESRVSPRTFFQDAVESFALRARQKSLRFDLHFTEAVPEVVITDSLRFRQVVNNLLSNAIKFTPEGSISLRVDYHPTSRRSEDSILEFTVKDTGIGIPASKQRDIFEPFTQADASTTRRYGGTGLGLSICHRLLRKLGGGIELESEEGVGSSFRAWFRVETAETSDSLDDAEPEMPGQEGLGIRVVVIEDDETNQQLIMRLLKSLQVDSAVYRDGQAGLNALLENRPDLVFVDLHLPDISGIEVIRRMREHYKSRRISLPMIAVLTADALESTRQRCQEEGVDLFLTKPVMREDFEGVIEAVRGIRTEE